MVFDPASQQHAGSTEPPEEEPSFKLLDLDDALLFAPRGIEGLARSLGQLPLDVLNLGGANIDVDLTENRFLGRSDTLIGGLAEGISQIALPFGVTHRLLSGVRQARFLGRALFQARETQAATTALQSGLTAAGGRLAQGVAAGAVADFVAFGGHEARLSNVIQAHPSLQNVVTEFLQAKPGEEPAIVGRMKSVLEGLGIGFAIDIIPAVLKGSKAFRKAQAAGKTPEESIAAAERAWDKAGAPEKAAEVLQRVEDETNQLVRAQNDLARENSIDIQDLSSGELEAGRTQVEQLGDEATEAADQARRTAAGDKFEAGIKGKKKVKKVGTQGLAEIMASGQDPSPLILLHVSKQSGGDPESLLRSGLAKFEELFANNQGLIRTRLGGDPKKLSREAKAVIGLSQNGLLDLKGIAATSEFVNADEEVITLVRMFEKFLDEQGVPLRLPKQTVQQQTIAAVPLASDLLDLGPEETAQLFGRVVQDLDRVTNFSNGLQMVIGGAATRIVRIMGAAVDPDSVTPELAKILGIEDALRHGKDAVEGAAERQMQNYALWVQALSRLRSGAGRALRTGQNPFTTRVLDLVGADVDAIRSGRSRELLGEQEFLKRMETISGLANYEAHTQATALTKFLKKRPADRTIAWTTEWVISSLLWSPKTSVTNALFPFLTSFMVPFENVVGGMLGGVTGLAKGNHLAMQEIRTLGSTMAGMMYAGKFLKRSMKEGPQFDPRLSRREDEFGRLGFRITSAETAGAVFGDKFGPGTLMGNVINAMGKFMEFPTRLMQTTDEFNKLFVAFSNGQGVLQEQAARLGKSDPASYVAENMGKLFDDGRLVSEKIIGERAEKLVSEEVVGQLAKSDPVRAKRKAEVVEQLKEENNFAELNPMAEELLRRGRETTATSELRSGTISNTVNKAADQHPIMRMIVPFIRTPANLAFFAGQRSPMDMAGTSFTMLYHAMKTKGSTIGAELPALTDSRFRNIRDLSSADPDTRASAVGRIATGAGIFMAAGMAANAGMITGHGPADEERRRALTDAGWLPYSFKTPEGNYVQFLRADPFSMMLGLAADVYETTKLNFELGDEDMFSSMGLGLVDGISQNITSRTYMAGLRSFMEAVASPERSGGQFLANFTPMPLPPIAVPRVFGQLKQHFSDPVLRDVHTLLERARQKTPWMGNQPPLRNVLGEPITRVTSLGSNPDSPASLWFDMFIPIAYREVSDDVIRREFVALQHGFSPPRRIKFGVDTSDFSNVTGRNAYDRWGELHGQVRLQGRTMRQEMHKLISSRQYQKLPKESLDFQESPRVRLLKGIVSRYRAKAFNEMMREFPDVRREVRRNRQDQAAILSGRTPSRQPQEIPFPFREFAQ